MRTSLHDHSYVHVHTQGLGTPTASQHNNIFDSEKFTNISCAPDGFELVVTDGDAIEP